jgi:glucose 1-dehydrogenase
MEQVMTILAGQTALVTGANSGIGAEIARAMGAAGANIGVNYVSGEEAVSRVVREIKDAQGSAMAIKADVSKEDQVMQMFRTLIKEYGTVDILVSNAGVQQDSPFEEMSLEQWHSVLEVNLTGAFLCAREAAREFLRRGIVPEGKLSSPARCTKSSPGPAMPTTPRAKAAS